MHWLWDQDTEEKASTLFGGLAAAGLLMGSTGSVGRVMGALWALTGTGLSAWKGFSGESQGEDVDEEKEETSLDCWLSARGGERSCCGAVSAEGGDVIDRGDKHDKCKVLKVNRLDF